MTDIPTSNKPSTPAKESKTSTEQEIKDAISRVTEIVKTVVKLTKDTECIKVRSLWDIGLDVKTAIKGLNRNQSRSMLIRFTKEAGMSESFYYLGLQMVNTFTKEESEQARKNGLSVHVLKALVAVKDPKMRAMLLKQVIEEGLNADGIRTIKGAAKAAQAAKADKVTIKDKPPIKVFSQGVDRMVMAEESIAYCTDAVGRLTSVNDEAAKHDSLKELLKLRGAAEKVIADANSFLKFTEAFASKVKK